MECIGRPGTARTFRASPAVRKVDIRLPGKGNSNSHGARPVYFTEMCSGSEEGSYLRLIDCVYPSTLGLRVIKKNQKKKLSAAAARKPEKERKKGV